MIIDKDFVEWIKPSFEILYTGNKFEDFKSFKIKTGHHGMKRLDYLGKNKNDVWIAIEFEQGDQFSQITKGITQIDDFYYLLKNKYITIYDPYGLEIIPKYFVLATKYSKYGYVYKNDNRIISTGGYSDSEEQKDYNRGIFYLTRLMWRFCGREQNLLQDTNVIGTQKFSVIDKYYDGKPCVHLYGNSIIKIEDLK